MKVIIYTLTESGEIPSHIVDGGYFPKPNDNASPQDYDLVGLAETSTDEPVLASKAEVLAYCQTFMNDYTDPILGTEYSVEDIVNQWCADKGIS